MYISSILYLWIMLERTGPWVIFFNKKWVHTIERKEALNMLITNMIQNDIAHFSLAKKKIKKKALFIKFLNSFILKVIKKKECVFTSGGEKKLEKFFKNKDQKND